MNETKSSISLSRRLVRSAFGAIPGILLALLVFTCFGYSVVATTVLGLLAVLAGIGLSQPEVSAKNVAIGTVGMIAAHNAPPILREKILDATLGGKEATRHSPSRNAARSEPPDGP